MGFLTAVAGRLASGPDAGDNEYERAVPAGDQWEFCILMYDETNRLADGRTGRIM